MSDVRYAKDSAYERRMWHLLTKVASGNTICVIGWNERDASIAFDTYVAALESIGLDRSVWSAYKTNGNRMIRFKNGGEIRFVSRSHDLRGMKIGTVVVYA